MKWLSRLADRVTRWLFPRPEGPFPRLDHRLLDPGGRNQHFHVHDATSGGEPRHLCRRHYASHERTLAYAHQKGAHPRRTVATVANDCTLGCQDCGGPLFGHLSPGEEAIVRQTLAHLRATRAGGAA